MTKEWAERSREGDTLRIVGVAQVIAEKGDGSYKLPPIQKTQ
jgi:hypothetical protein